MVVLEGGWLFLMSEVPLYRELRPRDLALLLPACQLLQGYLADKKHSPP